MPVVLFFLVTVLSSWSFADIEIQDPNHVLQNLPPLHATPEFSQAFSCGKPVPFFVKAGKCKVHCDTFMCEEQCPWEETVSADFQAEDCEPNAVSIYSTQGHSINVTKEDYDQASGTLALTLLKSISLFYEDIEAIRIEHTLFPYPKNFIENGQKTPLMLTVLSVSVFPDKTNSNSVHLMIGLDLQRSGLDQVMCIGSETVCDSKQGYFLKRKGLVNANN